MPGLLNKLLVTVTVAGCAPGLVRFVAGVLETWPGRRDPLGVGDVGFLAGAMLVPGLVLALAPLLTATFRRSLSLRIRLLLWCTFAISVAGMYLFGIGVGSGSFF
jgi:hypothetical protein